MSEALGFVRGGVTPVVWRLGRIVRPLAQLIEVIANLDVRQVRLNSLTEQIDTTTSGGKLIFHIFGAFAGVERELIRENPMAGVVSAQAR